MGITFNSNPVLVFVFLSFASNAVLATVIVFSHKLSSLSLSSTIKSSFDGVDTGPPLVAALLPPAMGVAPAPLVLLRLLAFFADSFDVSINANHGRDMKR